MYAVRRCVTARSPGWGGGRSRDSEVLIPDPDAARKTVGAPELLLGRAFCPGGVAGAEAH